MSLSEVDIEATLRFVLPSPVEFAFSVTYGEAGPLTADEATYIAAANSKRRADFATGRRCAIAALAKLGVVKGGLGRLPDGRASWPEGFVGSISHCDGLCLAAALRASEAATIGVDVERARPLPDGVLARIADTSEARLSVEAGIAAEVAGSAIFSAKECVFKALYPLLKRYIAFDEVFVVFAPREGTFTAVPRSGLLCERVAGPLLGRVTFVGEHVVTALILAAATEIATES
jgi:4'-phosphopantetheinyl transferase EntD